MSITCVLREFFINLNIFVFLLKYSTIHLCTYNLFDVQHKFDIYNILKKYLISIIGGSYEHKIKLMRLIEGKRSGITDLYAFSKGGQLKVIKRPTFGAFMGQQHTSY